MSLICSMGLAVPFTWRKWIVATALIAVTWPHSALAQQAPAPAAPAPAAPAQAPAPPQQFQQSGEWAKLPRMQLERQFAGPLQDTVIQRLRDTVDGTVCYIYLPISVAHSATTATGFVQYGPNTIGSINCIPTIPAPAPARR
jgi:hypothetical protein